LNTLCTTFVSALSSICGISRNRTGLIEPWGSLLDEVTPSHRASWDLSVNAIQLIVADDPLARPTSRPRTEFFAEDVQRRLMTEAIRFRPVFAWQKATDGPELLLIELRQLRNFEFRGLPHPPLHG
jgi:hypothetical protein